MRLDKRKTCICITLIIIVLLLLYEIVGIEFFAGEIADEKLKNGTDITVTRLLGGVVFLVLVAYSGYRVLDPIKKPFWRSLLFCLPAFAVAVNNLPIYSLVGGYAEVTSPLWRVLLLALECFAVGLFEECCFRGFVFIGFLEKRRSDLRGRFLAIVYSSAVFAAVHIINIFLGASPVAVLMQLGYSFLIGAMCAVMLMKSSNIWLCVAAHGIFNFCGALVPTCGEGSIWEPFTIVLTVVVSLIVTAYFVLTFINIEENECDRLYK